MRYAYARMTMEEAPRTLFPLESIPTLEVTVLIPCVCPLRTTMAPLTTQHACSLRTLISAGMGDHCNVAILSFHTSLLLFFDMEPPHTTRLGRVPRNVFTPARDALHTPVKHYAPTSPLDAATRAHTSGREVARLVDSPALGFRSRYNTARARWPLLAPPPTPARSLS